MHALGGGDADLYRIYVGRQRCGLDPAEDGEGYIRAAVVRPLGPVRRPVRTIWQRGYWENHALGRGARGSRVGEVSGLAGSGRRAGVSHLRLDGGVAAECHVPILPRDGRPGYG